MHILEEEKAEYLLTEYVNTFFSNRQNSNAFGLEIFKAKEKERRKLMKMELPNSKEYIPRQTLVSSSHVSRALVRRYKT